jgi:hypothetical protein
MYTEMALTTRRFALALAVAGIAAMGSVAVAPAAAAAHHGPDDFLELEHGRAPIFFCDHANPHKQHNNCIDLTGPTRF